MAIQANSYPDFFGLPLYGSQDLMVNDNPVFGFETNSCFAFQESQNQNLFPPNYGFESSSSSTFNYFLPQYLHANRLDMQRQEIDCLLRLQNERLKSALQEQRRQQLTIMLKSVESKAISLMKQKEEELLRATNKTKELEACLRRAQAERESWQGLAVENEAMATSLSNKLEQVRERFILSSDTESIYCGSRHRDKEAAENKPKKIVCRRCNSRASCFVFLPCRHLCSCKSCEAFFTSCPVCESSKEGSLEVFWV